MAPPQGPALRRFTKIVPGSGQGLDVAAQHQDPLRDLWTSMSPHSFARMS